MTEETRDTKDAFKPGSEHFGALIWPSSAITKKDLDNLSRTLQEEHDLYRQQVKDNKAMELLRNGEVYKVHQRSDGNFTAIGVRGNVCSSADPADAIIAASEERDGDDAT